MISEYEDDKVFWTRKMNIKLVKFIEKRPHIWDPKHPNYTSVGIRNQTYEEFASYCGNGLTARTVRDRWTNIRTTFAKQLRKLLENRAKNSEQEHKVLWHLWEPCQFLVRVSKNVNLDHYSQQDDILTDHIDDNSQEENNEFYDQTSKEDDKLRILPTCNSIAENLLDVFKKIQNDLFDTDNTENGKIGRLVAKTLSNKNSFDAASASQKIMNVLLLYDVNNPINPSNLKSDEL